MSDLASIHATARKVLHAIGPLHRALSRRRGNLIHWPAYHPHSQAYLGSDYGGWTIIPDLIDSQSVVYSVGVGNDITFDAALIARFGCVVHAFDPTPVSRGWVARQVLPAGFEFHPVGLANKDEDVAFAMPGREDWDSFSMAKDGTTEEVVWCPVRRLESIAAELGHDRIDLLKMDIEGFEYGVIDDVLAGPLRPVQWMIEFHHNINHFVAEQTRRAVEQLEAAGYRLFTVSNLGREYSFVHRSAV